MSPYLHEDSLAPEGELENAKGDAENGYLSLEKRGELVQFHDSRTNDSKRKSRRNETQYKLNQEKGNFFFFSTLNLFLSRLQLNGLSRKHCLYPLPRIYTLLGSPEAYSNRTKKRSPVQGRFIFFPFSWEWPEGETEGERKGKLQRGWGKQQGCRLCRCQQPEICGTPWNRARWWFVALTIFLLEVYSLKLNWYSLSNKTL